MTGPDGDRRATLARLVTAGAALLGTALAALVGVVAAPRATAPARRWRRVASIFDLGPHEPLQAVVSERYLDGWYETRRQRVVYVDREGDGYRVLSATCTHLGCGVQWNAGAGQFHCPCHGGVFDRDGRVVSGPPPRPLDRLTARVNPDTADIEVEV